MSMLSYISAFQHPDHYRDIRSPLTLCWFKSCCSLVTELIREKKKKKILPEATERNPGDECLRSTFPHSRLLLETPQVVVAPTPHRCCDTYTKRCLICSMNSPELAVQTPPGRNSGREPGFHVLVCLLKSPIQVPLCQERNPAQAGGIKGCFHGRAIVVSTASERQPHLEGEK